jgi:hypothetical protein
VTNRAGLGDALKHSDSAGTVTSPRSAP